MNYLLILNKEIIYVLIPCCVLRKGNTYLLNIRCKKYNVINKYINWFTK